MEGNGMKTGTVKQILLLTDGCSNRGENPSAMAALAREEGLVVNVIGVMSKDISDERAMGEIEQIAIAGGGIHQIVYAEQLSQTVQMVTRKAMNETIQGVVNKELQQILGNQLTLEELPPEKRGEIMEVVEDLGETVKMEVLVLVDTSASMKHKLPTVKEALIDLSISLNARSGDNQFAVYIFPGKRAEAELVLDWSPRVESLSRIFEKLTTGGITPTGPAIREAIRHFKDKSSLRRLADDDESYSEETM
jgi:Ca-activated chloride channel homolog